MNHTDFSVRLSLFYGAMFLVIGLYMPFFPVWLEHREMSKSEIAILISSPMIARVIFSPLLSFITDQFGNRRLALILMLWCSLISCFLLQFSHNFYVLLFIVTLFGIFWTTVMPVTEAMAMHQVRRNGMHYGKVRLWGSITFMLMSMAAGWLIDFRGPHIVWPVLMLTILLTLLLSYTLPKSESSPDETRLEKAAPLPPIRPKDFWTLVKNPVFILFIFAGGLGMGGHAFYYGFGTLHWYAIGYSGQLIGLLWAIGVLAEIILFIYYKKWFENIRADYLLFFGSLIAIFRWFITSFDPPLWILFATQTLHAFSFAMIHIGAVHFISSAVPEKLSSTAQGIYAAFSMGLLLGIMTMLSGPLYESFAGYGYMIMSLSAMVATLLSWRLMTVWNGAQISLQETE